MEAGKEGTGWQESACLNGRLHIRLPEGWETPAEAVLAEKFPCSTRPQEIFADSQSDRIFTMSRMEKQLQERQVYPAAREIQRVVSRIYPESIEERAQIIKTKAGTAGFFSFLTGGIAEDTCHFMFILPDADEKMLLGSLHLPAGQMHYGRELLVKVIRSIQDEDAKKESFRLRRKGTANERIPDSDRAI